MTTFFYLIASHFICDYPLQSDFIAVGKNPDKSPHNGVPWQWIMLAHAFTHGCGVALATGNVWLGMAETVAHYVIDFGKCDDSFGTGASAANIDQWLHIGCKVLWYAIFVFLGLSHS